MAQSKLPTAAKMIEDLVDNSWLLTDKACPFSFHVQKGQGRVVVIAGDNATGKSMLTSMLAAQAHQTFNVSPMVVSMTARTGSGMMRAFTYGDESYRATGEVSVSVSMRALNNLPKRLEEKGAGMVVLDEPDLGLAEGYAHAFGQKLAERINALPAKGRWNVVLVSHSRELVQGLVDGLDTAPTFVHADQPKTLAQWLDKPQRKSVEEFDALMDAASRNIKTVARILEEAEQQSKKRPAKKPKP